MFKIILINVEFCQVLNERGDLQMREEKEYNPCFNSLSSALIKKDNLLERYIYSGVIIKNTETGKNTTFDSSGENARKASQM